VVSNQDKHCEGDFNDECRKHYGWGKAVKRFSVFQQKSPALALVEPA
jgi:hypothetical protein